MGTSHSSALLRTHSYLINKQYFVKNKILKYKVSQLQLNTALDNCKKLLKENPNLELLPDVICQMPDSK